MTPERMEVDIIQAIPSNAHQMASLWVEAFEAEDSKLTQLMYAGVDLLARPMLEDILTAHVGSEDNKFVICHALGPITYDSVSRYLGEEDWPLEEEHGDFEEGEGEGGGEGEEGSGEEEEEEEEKLTFGWISVGILPESRPDSNFYAVSDFGVYVCWKLLASEALARGEDPRYLGMNNPRFRLVYELSNRSTDGQSRHFNGAYLVVNALVLYPKGHEDETWELAFKLLGWATSYAERRSLSIWTQIPANHMGYFRQAGFREVRAFTLNLNDYAPRGSTDNWGTQEWVQMVYRASGDRRTRSISPRDEGTRRRRLSF